jgi:hypothetical protein
MKDINTLRSDLYSSVSSLQTMMEPVFEFQSMYTTTKAKYQRYP